MGGVGGTGFGAAPDEEDSTEREANSLGADVASVATALGASKTAPVTSLGRKVVQPLHPFS